MSVFLQVVVPILSVILYFTVALSVFTRYRRRHVQDCPECQRKIRDNINSGSYPWNHLLCDKYDINAPFIAAAWPIAWFAILLRNKTRVDERPSWLVVEEQRKRIAQLEQEAGLR